MIKNLVFLIFLLFSSISYAQLGTNNAHLKQTFRYAKDVNPVDFLKLDPRIIEMIGGVAQFCKKHNITFMITSAIRSPERNKEVKSVSTTHVDGRAIDFSIKPHWGWTPVLIKRLENYINSRFGEYGIYAPMRRQKVIVVHDANNGTGLHVHLQVAREYNDSYSNILGTMEEIICR